MADIVIDLGTVTIKDHADNSGKLTQQNLRDWLDGQFDVANAGGNYAARIRRAIRIMGLRGAQNRAGAYTNQQLRTAVVTRESDIVEEVE